ncbi:MAG: hypothetical protein NC420_11400, partial [Eubacterium sp.]|nr:hypothetical protein [Eubacterium sp.]
MRKRVFLFLLVFCLLLPACASADQAGAAPVPTPDASDGQPVEPDMEVPSTSEDIPAPELSERDRNWINDIHYLQ